MAYKKKKRYIPRKKQSTPPEGFLCFWKLVKDVSRKGRLSFTIQDKEGNLTVVDIEDGDILVICCLYRDFHPMVYIFELN